MERLTHRYIDGEAWASIYKVSACGEDECKGPIVERLAAYEDTGLGPEEIRELLHQSYGPLHKKLGEWIDAEQDGQLVVLPCNAGDTVYKIFCNKIISAVIEKVEINAFTNPKIWVQVGTEFMSSQCYRFDLSCGRDFYLTREEAEAALAGQKKEAHGEDGVDA